VRAPADLAHGLVRELDQPRIERDRLDAPDPLPRDLDVLLAREPLARLTRERKQPRELAGVEVALVEQLLRPLDDRGDDPWPADDAARRADPAPSHLDRDRPDSEREPGRAGERVAPLVHRRRPGVGGLPA